MTIKDVDNLLLKKVSRKGRNEDAKNAKEKIRRLADEIRIAPGETRGVRQRKKSAGVTAIFKYLKPISGAITSVVFDYWVNSRLEVKELGVQISIGKAEGIKIKGRKLTLSF